MTDTTAGGPISGNDAVDCIGHPESDNGTPERGPVEFAGFSAAPQPILDFTADPETVKVLVEGERLSFGHLTNPTFATEISSIDPLPHQRIAVYDHMLGLPKLRFLLADDAGAGKTIMSGLYVREMLSRRLIRRILIVPPAGLVGNWHRELLTLFNLSFRIVTGRDAQTGNPFKGEAGDRIIVSMDTLTGKRMFDRLQESGVTPYDLVIFDEAHKLAADRGNDFRVHLTRRYRLAEALAGAYSGCGEYRPMWSARHLLLLTATPHMGKDYPYYALWRLLDPAIFATQEAFDECPPAIRRKYFIRRTKEEMVHPDGRPLYPKRISDTLGYELSQGPISEQTLYNETTDYLRYFYNRAKVLNREAARLAMSVFQRRLASSTFALLRSFERRLEKLDALIDDIQNGKITTEQMLACQSRSCDEDLLDTTTADEEGDEEHGEVHEETEDTILQGVVAASIADLQAEREIVFGLLEIARKVENSGQESKFEKLNEILSDKKFDGEKFIIFTEHRDTLAFLVKRLDAMGHAGTIAQIHGGMNYLRREEEVEQFRKPHNRGGARFLICTDAAGEGINLQFCRIMINYDVPWNPARLEQRMGRIHRYGQKHDPVIIVNIVAPSTREGKVLKVLLDKLERIRRELRSDKVFDCIGRIFEGISIRQYMELAITADADEVARQLDGQLTKEQVEALAQRERVLFGSGGDVVRELPRLRSDMERDIHYRLLPGYVRQYVQQAAPFVDIGIDGDTDGVFSLYPLGPGAMSPLSDVLPPRTGWEQAVFSFKRTPERSDVIWLHPGEPVFERFREMVRIKLANEGIRGAIFIDPSAPKPYLFHMALLTILRRADPDFPEFGAKEILECRPFGIRQEEDGKITLCPIEHLLLLRGGCGLYGPAQHLAIVAAEETERAREFLIDHVAHAMATERKNVLAASIPEREEYIGRGFDFQEAELVAMRSRHSEKARNGNRAAIEALEDIKRRQRELSGLRRNSIAALRMEPELVQPGTITFIAHAIVVPSIDSADIERYDADVEMAAMRVVQVYEETAGARVIYVHTPELARHAGLPENPGFDILSLRPGGERRSIEVKGRATIGDIEVSANEWAKACNMRDAYWLYAVYDCAAPAPRLVRVQDPFGALLARAKGSMLISMKQVLDAREGID